MGSHADYCLKRVVNYVLLKFWVLAVLKIVNQERGYRNCTRDHGGGKDVSLL